MKPSITTSEIISALADGQLDDDALAVVLKDCAHDDSLLECWNTYHMIGDALRSPSNTLLPMPLDSGRAFAQRFSLRMAQESTLCVQPSQIETIVNVEAQPAELIHHRGRASNDSSFRWKLVAGVASLAAVSVMVWNAPMSLAPSSMPQLAQGASPQIMLTGSQGPMVRDARLDELLAAHRQFGLGSALQESSGFLRNAAFELPLDSQAAGGR